MKLLPNQWHQLANYLVSNKSEYVPSESLRIIFCTCKSRAALPDVRQLQYFHPHPHSCMVLRCSSLSVSLLLPPHGCASSVCGNTRQRPDCRSLLGGLIHQQCDGLCLTAICQTQSGVGEEGEVCLALASACMLRPHIGVQSKTEHLQNIVAGPPTHIAMVVDQVHCTYITDILNEWSHLVVHISMSMS